MLSILYSNLLGVQYLWTECGSFGLILRLHLLGIISPTGSNELIWYYLHMGEPMVGFTLWFKIKKCLTFKEAHGILRRRKTGLKIEYFKIKLLNIKGLHHQVAKIVWIWQLLFFNKFNDVYKKTRIREIILSFSPPFYSKFDILTPFYTCNLISLTKSSEAIFKEFEPRLKLKTLLKYGWFLLIWYSMF